MGQPMEPENGCKWLSSHKVRLPLLRGGGSGRATRSSERLASLALLVGLVVLSCGGALVVRTVDEAARWKEGQISEGRPRLAARLLMSWSLLELAAGSFGQPAASTVANLAVFGTFVCWPLWSGGRSLLVYFPTMCSSLFWAPADGLPVVLWPPALASALLASVAAVLVVVVNCRACKVVGVFCWVRFVAA